MKNTIDPILNLNPGDKVIYIPENKIYDFRYIGQNNNIIIAEEGEYGMQSSWAVKIETLKVI